MSNQRTCSALAMTVALAAAGSPAVAAPSGSQGVPSCSRAEIDPSYLPDIATVVPDHLQITNSANEFGQHREVLRFSNKIANLGFGDWRMRPQFPDSPTDQTQEAIQQILVSNDPSQVLCEETVSVTFFHPTHNHWHMMDIALFEVRRPSRTDPDLPDMSSRGVVGGNSVKTTFCLIDWVKLDGNSPTKERVYFECSGGTQGISPEWTDQYHQATEGQQLDLTDVPDGVYYLVSIANNEGVYLELDTSNNGAWVRFELSGKGTGSRGLAVIGHSDCDSFTRPDGTPVVGMCADDQTANR